MKPNGQWPGMMSNGQWPGMMPNGQWLGMMSNGQWPGMMPDHQWPGMMQDTQTDNTGTDISNFGMSSKKQNQENDPFRFRLPTGLVNMGCTCNLNSMLQSLYAIPEFRSIILNRPESEGNRIVKELKNLFQVMQKRNGKTICPERFFYSLGFDDQAKYVPRDASMERRTLFSVLRKPNGWSELDKIFCGEMKNITLFRCGHMLEVTQTFEDFHLPLRLTSDSATVDTLEEALKNVVSPQDLSKEQCAFKCPKCGPASECKAQTVQAVYVKLPPILLVQLARFKFTRSAHGAEKVNDRVAFPLELDFSEVFDGVENATNVDHEHPRPKYELLSVVAHRGTLENGHYMAYARDLDAADEPWYLFNDSLVCRVAEGQLESTFGGSWNSFCAQYLVYHRKDSLPHTAANRRDLDTADEPWHLSKDALMRRVEDEQMQSTLGWLWDALVSAFWNIVNRISHYIPW